MKTIPVLILSAVTCLSLPHFTRGQALPFQQSPPPGTPVPVTPPPPISPTGTTTPTTSVATSTIPDGFVMKDGRIYMVKNGELSPASPEQVRNLAPDGIPAGQMMTTDGRLVPMDPTLFTTSEERARAAAASNVSGDNRSGLAPTDSTSQTTSGSSSTAQPTGSDAFSTMPPTGRRGNSSTSRGSSSTTLFDAFGNPIVINRPIPPGTPGVTQPQPIIPPGNGNSGTIDRRFQPTTGQQQTNTPQSTTGTGSSSTATPNQQNSTGTNIDPNATGASSTATPNQLNSRGTNTGPNARTTPPRPVTPNQLNSSGTNTTTNPNATRTGTGSTGATSTTGTGTTSTSSGSTSSGSTSTSGGSSSGGSSSSGSSGGTSSGGTSGGAVR